MKKRIAAVLLTLCMVIGALPLAALAATYTATIDGTEYIVSVDDETNAVTSVKTQDGTDADNAGYYNFSIVKQGEADVLQYYKLGEVKTATITKVTDTVVATPNENGAATVPEVTVDEKLSEFTIDATHESAPTDKVALTIPKSVMDSLVAAEVDVTIDTNAATVVLPAGAVNNINEAANGEAVTLGVAPKDNPEAVPSTATTATTVDVSLKAGTKDIGSNIGVAIDVTIKVELSYANPCLYWLNGSVFKFFESTYNATAKTLTWTTTHLSDWVTMSRADAEAAGLDTVVPAPGEDDIIPQPFAAANVQNAGAGKVYTVNDVEGKAVLYQTTEGTKSVFSLIPSAKADSVEISASANAQVRVWVAETITWTDNAWTYTNATQAYDSKL